MRKLLLALFLVTACVNTEVQIEVDFVQTEEELEQKCGDSLMAEPLGCAIRHGNSCRIVAYEPRHFEDRRRLETLGHEVLHCIKGPKHI